YMVGGRLFGAPFDLRKVGVRGAADPIVEGVSGVAGATAGAAHFASSNWGALVYVAGPVSAAQTSLLLSDRQGASEALKLPPGLYMYPRVSPDGRYVAFETADRKEIQVAIFELSGASAVRRLTFGGNNRYPTWAAGGH